jgi:hypothetical protein
MGDFLFSFCLFHQFKITKSLEEIPNFAAPTTSGSSSMDAYILSFMIANP